MNNRNLYTVGIELFSNMENVTTAVSTDNSVLIQRLHQSELLTVYLLTSSAMPAGKKGKSIVDLSSQIADVFNKDELVILCKTLGEDLENLEGGGKNAKCLSLVELMRRHGRLAELITYLKKHRPKSLWPNANQIILPDIVKKDDLAVVVGMISRRESGTILHDVTQYLGEIDKDAHILLLATSGSIPPTADWNEFPIVFRQVIDIAKRQTGMKTAHFFLASVGGVLFSMGGMWGTLDKSVIYHRYNGEYMPIIQMPL